jgi:hypothetical protein
MKRGSANNWFKRKRINQIEVGGKTDQVLLLLNYSIFRVPSRNYLSMQNHTTNAINS